MVKDFAGKLQFISHHNERFSYLEGIEMALNGGCRWIQLRMKDANDDELEKTAVVAQEMCKRFGATFVIDDRVDLVKKLKADGVHLGKNDMPIGKARSILGKGFIIGATANTFSDIESHAVSGADYIGCGPFRYTTTKQKLSPILGLEGYKSIICHMRRENISLPIVAIGGITHDDIDDIMATGMTGIALSGSILNATDPTHETERIVHTISEATRKYGL